MSNKPELSKKVVDEMVENLVEDFVKRLVEDDEKDPCQGVEPLMQSDSDESRKMMRKNILEIIKKNVTVI